MCEGRSLQHESLGAKSRQLCTPQTIVRTCNVDILKAPGALVHGSVQHESLKDNRDNVSPMSARLELSLLADSFRVSSGELRQLLLQHCLHVQ